MYAPNILLAADSYKLSHYRQYPQGTTEISSYIESRKGGDLRFFGLQAFLMQIAPVTPLQVSHLIYLAEEHGVPVNKDGLRRIAHDYQGHLPIEIWALPEGAVYPERTPLVQVRNTHPDFAWLTSYVETALLRSVWYPSSVATVSFRAKQRIYQNLVETADDPDNEILFKLHDFGARGVSSSESAMLGGMAHLLNFRGTDTIEALVGAAEFYSCQMAGFSIPAAEHSTITAWGKGGETDAYRNMLVEFSDHTLVAVVSDSYDIFNACDNIWGGVLKGRVERLGDQGRTLVIRPDSGDPKETVLRVIEILMDRFGFKTNSKGYKVLPKYLRIIQGDGVNLQSIGEILDAMKARGYSGSNIAFGMGGGLLQKVDRDTFGFAMKASEAVINGERRDVYKDPITDNGKKSKRGRQAVVLEDGVYKTVREDELKGRTNALRPVWSNGQLLVRETLEDLRSRAL